MKINSIKISNILSFENKPNFDDCQEIKFDDDLNIIIGANAAGKSNFLEIISQIFKSGLVLGCRYNEDALFQYNTTKNEQQLKNLITNYGERPHSLPPNLFSDVKNKMIKIKISINKDDITNLFFIRNNLQDLQVLTRKYSSRELTGFTREIKDEELQSANTFTFTFTEDGSRNILKPDITSSSLVDQFVLHYFYWFQHLQILITIAREREEHNWDFLKSTFALMSSYRSYSDFITTVTIDEKHKQKTQELPNRWYKEGTRKVETGEPVVFEYVKQKILEEVVKVESDLWENKLNLEGKTPIDLIQTGILQNINKFLTEQLELIFLPKHITINQYSFNFYNSKTMKQVDIAALSAGQKEIIHFIFSIFGYELENGLVIIDEPELHLHPRKQIQYLSIMKKIIEKFKIQFIIATHSPLFINESTINGVHRFYLKDKKYTNVIHPEITESEKELVQILTYTNSSKIFFVNKIVLVEGDSDEYFFRYFFDEYKRRKKKDDDDDIEFLYIRGKDRYNLWKSFLSKFEIQTYFIGDLDNIFSENFSIVNSTILESLKNEFDKELTTQTKKKNNVDYVRDSKCYNKDFLQYLKISKQTEWATIRTNITTKYGENIFILQEGELENYTNTTKKLEGIINFCKNDYAEWILKSENTEKLSELTSIFDKITTS